MSEPPPETRGIPGADFPTGVHPNQDGSRARGAPAEDGESVQLPEEKDAIPVQLDDDR